MDDFYDFGAETASVSDIIVMPGVLISAMWNEFQALGERQSEAMFRCGQAVGIALGGNYIEMDSDDQSLDEFLHLVWAEVGLGHLFVLETAPETVIVKIERMLEASLIPADMPCDLTRGCLAGILKALVQHPYSGEERRVSIDTRINALKPV